MLQFFLPLLTCCHFPDCLLQLFYKVPEKSLNCKVTKEWQSWSIFNIHVVIVLKTANQQCCEFPCSIYDVRKMSDVSIFEVCYTVFDFC